MALEKLPDLGQPDAYTLTLKTTYYELGAALNIVADHTGVLLKCGTTLTAETVTDSVTILTSV
jgi:hypothetical protein